MNKLNLVAILGTGVLCLILGWVGRGSYSERTELDERNQAMLYLATESSRAIFAKLGEFGVPPGNVEFVHSGSGIQVQIESKDSGAMDLAEALRPLVPDFGPTMVTFVIESDKGGGIMVYRDRVFDTRPLVSEMLTKLNQNPENP